MRKRYGHASRGTRRYDGSFVGRGPDRDGRLFRAAREQGGAGLLTRLHQERLRFGPPFDGSRFDPVGTVAHLVCGHAL